jgi:hypothetical protein
MIVRSITLIFVLIARHSNVKTMGRDVEIMGIRRIERRVVLVIVGEMIVTAVVMGARGWSRRGEDPTCWHLVTTAAILSQFYNLIRFVLVTVNLCAH